MAGTVAGIVAAADTGAAGIAAADTGAACIAVDRAAGTVVDTVAVEDTDSDRHPGQVYFAWSGVEPV